jgi:hypothetical protein
VGLLDRRLGQVCNLHVERRGRGGPELLPEPALATYPPAPHPSESWRLVGLGINRVG